mgnify:CR=1 FL=1
MEKPEFFRIIDNLYDAVWILDADRRITHWNEGAEKLAGYTAGEMIGQERALSALRFGASMPNSGYNLYVLGPAGAGKHTTVARFLQEKAAARPVPDDWVYVNNFSDQSKPRAMTLPQGRGANLRRAMQQLVEELRSAIPAAFESDDYKARIHQIDEEYESRQEAAFRELNEEAQTHNVKVFKTPGGFTFAPIKDGEVIDASAMNVRELRRFLEDQIEDSKKQVVLFSLHLKATMMKVSDPVMFGHCVAVYFRDALEKHADAKSRRHGTRDCKLDSSPFSHSQCRRFFEDARN